MFTNKKREGINRFVCDASLYVAKTSKASIKYHKPPLPIIPCGIVAYGFCWTTFLETAVYSREYFPLGIRRNYARHGQRKNFRAPSEN